MGYAGGQKANPSYYSLGQHSETIEIDFDPSVISYQELLDAFWRNHNPMARTYSTQYASIVFYHDETQRALAEQTKASLRAAGATIETEIVAFEAFHLAEDYHQKYYLQNDAQLWKEMSSIYPEMSDLIHSTAAARLNGYVGRNGSQIQFEADLPRLGLSEKGQERLNSLRR